MCNITLNTEAKYSFNKANRTTKINWNVKGVSHDIRRLYDGVWYLKACLPGSGRKKRRKERGGAIPLPLLSVGLSAILGTTTDFKGSAVLLLSYLNVMRHASDNLQRHIRLFPLVNIHSLKLQESDSVFRLSSKT